MLTHARSRTIDEISTIRTFTPETYEMTNDAECDAHAKFILLWR